MKGTNFWNYYTRQDLGYRNRFFIFCQTRKALNQWSLRMKMSWWHRKILRFIQYDSYWARYKADVTYLVEQWNHIYDVEFTKETFETPLRNNQVQMMVLIHQIDDIRAKIGEFKKKDPTVPKEFHFHELNIRGKYHLGPLRT